MDRYRLLPVPDLPVLPLALSMARKQSGSDILRIVRIGAFLGHKEDYLSQYLAHGESVRAVLVEPSPESFPVLSANMAEHEGVMTVRAAVGKQDETASLFMVRRDGRWSRSVFAPQLASLSRDHLIAHGVLEQEILSVPVTVLTLKSLLRLTDLDGIDLLIVDAEGSDHEILTDALDLEVPPSVICFEHRHVPQEKIGPVFSLLGRSGYRFLHGALDSLAVRFREDSGQ